MTVPTRYVGLDLDLKSNQITACIGTRPWKLLAGPSVYSDSLAGYKQLVAWLQQQHCTNKQTVLCMPASGYLGEPLAYYLALRGYRVAIAPSLKIRRALPARKAQRLDIGSREVAEYACRHEKLLRPWQPSAEILSQVQALLTNGHSQQLRSAKSGARTTKSHGAGRRLLLARDDRTGTLDAEIRRLLMPQPTIAQEWPCY